MENIIEILLQLLFVAGAVAIVIIVILAALLVWGIRRASYAIRGEEYRPLIGKKKSSYTHLDVDEGSDEKAIQGILNNYTKAIIVGPRSKNTLGVLERAQQRKESFYTVLKSKFSEESLSYGKFSSTMEMVYSAIMKNSAAIANKIQLFDRAGYRKAQKEHMRASFTNKEAIEVQSKKQRLEENLSSIDELIDTNNKLNDEIDKLIDALDELDDVETNVENNEVMSEIKTLINETKYYK